MKCLYCNCTDSKVLDSRSTDDDNAIRRRRECLGCGKRFTTYEIVETTPMLVIKKDGSRQPFDILKIKKGLIKSCEKRPVSLNQIDGICQSIESELQNISGEISSEKIGEMVMERLKQIDQVSYVRFASVYRRFEDVTNFKSFLNDM